MTQLELLREARNRLYKSVDDLTEILNKILAV